jgi:coenzyme F420-reducing hydrogenase beta subunit
LDQFYGSKYFQSYTSVGFDNILRDKTDQKYALFGTPCQIYAFSRTGRYRRNPQNYLLVDIFCHGCPSYNLWNSYLSYNLKKANCNSFESYAFRSKTYGWHEYSFDFINKGIKHSSKKINDPFVELFFGKDIMNAACYNCIPRSTMAYGDIRIGDYWGPRFDMDTKGVSAVIIKTSYGLDFLSNIRNKVSISDASFADIVASQTYGHDYQFNQDRREYLLKALRTNCDLDEIHVKYIRMLPLKMRSKRLVKAILKGCPNWAFFALKKLLHSI